MSTLSSSVNTLQLFAEPTRVRLMALLEEEELTVAELVNITELAQSSVSTHLGKLRDAGFLRDRRVGASTLYSLNDGNMPEGAKQVWSLVRGDLKDAVLDGDKGRCAVVLEARQRTNAWPDAVAGQMERHYSPGRTWEATARGLFGLMRLGDVLDAGAGDGTLAQLLAPRARSVTCLDRSEKMAEAARARLAKLKNTSVSLGDVQELPFGDAAFDQVMLFNILTQATTPGRVVAEAVRALASGKAGVLPLLLGRKSIVLAGLGGEPGAKLVGGELGHADGGETLVAEAAVGGDVRLAGASDAVGALHARAGLRGDRGVVLGLIQPVDVDVERLPGDLELLHNQSSVGAHPDHKLHQLAQRSLLLY